jgi:hypothetical protein
MEGSWAGGFLSGTICGIERSESAFPPPRMTMTASTNGPSLPTSAGAVPLLSRRNAVADHPLQYLEKARAALVVKRLTFAKAIATLGESPDAAIRAIIEVQAAIDVIDRAMDELDEVDELE